MSASGARIDARSIPLAELLIDVAHSQPAAQRPRRCATRQVRLLLGVSAVDGRLGRLATVRSHFAAAIAACAVLGASGTAFGATDVTLDAAAGGDITEWAIPYQDGFPQDVTAGPDGNVWFTVYARTGAGAVGRITPRGDVAVFPLAGIGNPWAITGGSRSLHLVAYVMAWRQNGNARSRRREPRDALERGRGVAARDSRVAVRARRRGGPAPRRPRARGGVSVTPASRSSSSSATFNVSTTLPTRVPAITRVAGSRRSSSLT